jgi:hypothetical protein
VIEINAAFLQQPREAARFELQGRARAAPGLREGIAR